MHRDRLVQVVGDDAVGDEVRGLGAGHREADPQDDAGQPDTADRRPEDRGVRIVGGALRGQLEHPAVGDEQLHPQHVVAERPGTVVVLAVHVVADRPAHRHLAGAGQHRDPQAVRQRGPHQRVEADAGVEVDRGAVRIDRVDRRQAGHVDDQAARILGHVTVRTAQAAGQHTAPAVGAAVSSGADRLDHRLGVVRVHHVSAGRGGASPSGQELGGGRGAGGD
ncbi:hypothetical protein SDC9_57352 [bioreactor metagenome]|uniref:Uncharacterized protein n=1 Tax=bioreactor metagenome TaxID=1076179 RepID=A0A644XA76_9ZZZZ